jgi:enoyl-[acyl-carrier protein] reductase II
MNRVTELLGIEYPLIQGGMAWVADHCLAAAVSNGGGLGLIAAGSADADWVRSQRRSARESTDKPFGVNVMLMNPAADDIMQVVLDECVPVITTGAGNPSKYVSALKAAGIKVIPVAASVALASRLERAGADAIVAEGLESGGHIGEMTTMALVPQIVDAVSVPVIAAGGIADGRGVAAAFMLGAEGVQIGTRFVASNECTASQAFKERIVAAKDSDTVVTGRATGRPVRVLKNKLTREIQHMEKTDVSLEEYEALLSGSLRAAVVDGDVERGSVMAGQIAGLIDCILPVSEIIAKLFGDARELTQKAACLSMP